MLKNGVYSAYVFTSFNLRERKGTIEVRVSDNGVEDWMSLEPEDTVSNSYANSDNAKAGHRKIVEEWKEKLAGYES